MTKKLRRNTANNSRRQWIITGCVGLGVGLAIALATPAGAPVRANGPAAVARQPDATPDAKQEVKQQAVPDEARMKADLYGYLLDLVHENPALFDKIIKDILAAPENSKQHMIALRALVNFGTRDPLADLCRVMTNPDVPPFIKQWAKQQIDLRCSANPSLRAKVDEMLVAKPIL